ncbi:class A beta-lactamase [Chitinibacteraceae bacterium HSL-7]
MLRHATTALALALCLPAAWADSSFQSEIAQLEAKTGGRIGVAVVDQHGKRLLGHRADARFAMCSTFKLPLAALVLQQVEQGRLKASQPLRYDADQLEDYAPAARRYLGSGFMTVTEANQASVQLSDNTAANLLLGALGGPAALTRFFRAVGDPISRLDRTEPTLNTNLPDDARDTTTPSAMATTTAKLLWGNALKPASRDALQRMLIGNTTGDTTLRAGLPADWQVGDKTGSCDRDGRNDVAFVVPKTGVPFVLAVYSNQAGASANERNQTLAEVARIVARTLGSAEPSVHEQQ